MLRHMLSTLARAARRGHARASTRADSGTHADTGTLAAQALHRRRTLEQALQHGRDTRTMA
eukprot:15168674-Alexandrium_andersonii.AAC.1